eukprot:365817-Chlamydomonas_euryale.AAC.2
MRAQRGAHLHVCQPAYCEQQHPAEHDLIVIVHHDAARQVEREQRNTEYQALPARLRMRDGQSEELQARAYRHVSKRLAATQPCEGRPWHVPEAVPHGHDGRAPGDPQSRADAATTAERPSST